MNPLAALIRERMSDKGWSTYDVERQGGPPARTVAHLADPHVQWRVTPRPDTIRKLATGLQLPEPTILEAAKAAIGPQTKPDAAASPHIDVVVAAMRELPADRQVQIEDFVLRMIETWAPDLRAVAAEGNRADAKQADKLAAAERAKQKPRRK